MTQVLPRFQKTSDMMYLRNNNFKYLLQKTKHFFNEQSQQ